MRRALRVGLAIASASALWACAVDQSLREYLSTYFWMPFAMRYGDLAPNRVERYSSAFAGMNAAATKPALARMERLYQTGAALPESSQYKPGELQSALAEARSDPSLTQAEREEVDLIDAKIALRAKSLPEARKKLSAFLKTAQTPELLSEARGWLAHVYYLAGEQSAAAKIYLDELNRTDSNLSRDTLLNSLSILYGSDGGLKLWDQLEDYFDTPEHAAFAIKLATNPQGSHEDPNNGPRLDSAGPKDALIPKLLERHSDLLKTNNGADLLTMLGMRAALSAGDPRSALRIANQASRTAAVQQEPDFLWMLGASYYLSRQYAGAQGPLLQLFSSRRASRNQQAAAAYGLCGVYQKLGNRVEQLRYALWLSTGQPTYPTNVQNQSVYWAASGFDLGLLLEAEASMEDLRIFQTRYPALADSRLVRYSLAVRLARKNQYAEAAEIYQALNVPDRAAHMREMADLYREGDKLKIAEYLSANSEAIYFNDQLWYGFQRYALTGKTDTRFSRAERNRQIAVERKLKDDQEELWRAYLLLRDVVREEGRTDRGRKAAQLAIRCLRQINVGRFEREEEIQKGDIELTAWLRRQ